MTLKRWHEEEATPNELQVLAASRSEEPDPAVYRKTLALALGASATAATPAVAGRWLAAGTTKLFVALTVVSAVVSASSSAPPALPPSLRSPRA